MLCDDTYDLVNITRRELQVIILPLRHPPVYQVCLGSMNVDLMQQLEKASK
ncbi:hypothetical protein Q31b_14080 [Novipirellula aureliae]|uniref:Uncharacterized protein n=1 Tax=Novipirellula aureliae TaxID=2527966 RepID=A0A5C6E8U9_9BACT|nr:hypothetical protein [Novipirellula aureliae]TWU43876.1 hypothetical protein Q31b_14080 [Novipirellula aureliae]